MTKVLLIEDDDTLTYGIRIALEKKGYEIYASFLKRYIAVGLNINTECFHEIVLSTKQAAEKSLPPAVLLFIFIGFVFIDVTANVVYRITNKVENDFSYIVDDEAIYRHKKGISNDISNK